MSGLFGAGAVKKAAPEVSSLRVTTASYGRPIPIVIGQARVATWVFWYGDFKAIPHEESAGGKGGSGNITSYTYQAALAQGLCEGPINTVGTIWRGSDVLTPTTTAAQTVSGTESVIIRSNLVANLDGLGSATLNITSVSIGWRWDNITQYTSPTDFTQTTNKSLTFVDSALIGQTVNVSYTATIAAQPVAPLGQVNATLFKGDYAQGTWSWLNSAHPTQSLNYRGIAYLASPAYDLGGSSDMPNTGVEVDSVFGFSDTIRDCNPRDLLAQYLTNPYWGAMIEPGSLGDWRDWANYCVANGLFLTADYLDQQQAASVVTRIAAATNSDIVSSAGKIRIVPYADQAVTGNGVTWTPNLVAVYELTTDHFAPGTFKAQRKDPLERYNAMRVKFRNRALQYNEDVADAKDDGNIALNGLRSAQDLDVPEIKRKDVAQTVANLAQQRAMNVATTYTFRLPFRFAMLEPMDLLALTYPPLQLNQRLMRITSIKESNWWLDVTTEEVPIGVASAITYPYEAPLGYQVDTNIAPGNCNTPLVFEGPAVRGGNTGVVVYVAVRGDGPYWGGAQIWTSMDGTNYKMLADIDGGARYGTLAAAMTNVATSLQVTGLGAAQLLSGTTADAQAFNTLCLVGDAGGANPEFLAYETATLTGAGAYTLGSLVRAGYGSTAVAHGAGSWFVRIDERVPNSGPLDESMVGKTLYVKCLSKNIYGGGAQSLADVSPVTYVITGLAAGFLPGVAGKGLLLSASSLVFQYPQAGGVNPSSITLTATRKGTLQGAVSWAVTSGTATLTGSGDTRTVAAASMTTDTVTISATITDGVGSYSDRVTLVKVREGADAATLVLQANAQTFTFDKLGAASPTSQTINLQAVLANLVGTATYLCTLYNAAGTSIGTPTLGGSGNNRTLTVAQFGAAAYAVVTATLSAFSDTETLVRLQDGADSVVSDLDNQAVSLTCDSSGNVTDYTGASTTMKVYVGLTDDSANWSFSRTNSTGVSSTLSGHTVTITAMTAAVDSGYVDITATRAGYVTQVQRFSIGKSKSGVQLDKITTTVSNFTVTKASHVPDGESFRDAVMTINYTPPTSCTATLTVSGVGTYTTGSSLDYGEFIAGLYISGSFDANDSMWAYAKPGVSSQFGFTLSGTRSFSLTGGVAYTFVFLGKKFADTCVINYGEMRLEAFK